MGGGSRTHCVWTVALGLYSVLAGVVTFLKSWFNLNYLKCVTVTVTATANKFCTRTLALDYSSSSVVVFLSSVFGKDYLADPFRQRWCLLVRIWILALLCFQRKLMLFCFFFPLHFFINCPWRLTTKRKRKRLVCFSTLVEAGLSVLSFCVC